MSRERLKDAAERIISRFGSDTWSEGESISAVGELAAGNDLARVRLAARVARIRVDHDMPPVRPQDRSLARPKAILCSPPERCFVGAEHTSLGWEPVFIREAPRSDVSRLQEEMVKCWGTVLHPQLARPRRIDRIGDQLVIGFDRIAGISLDRLGPLPAPLALALLADARAGLDALHAEGMTHGALTPKRVRLAASGHVCLCYGADALQTTAAEDHAAVARLILGTAFDDGLLFEILAGEDEGACTVACDRIVDLEPSLDDLAVAALRPDGHPSLIPAALVRSGMRDAASLVMAAAFEEVANT